MESLEDHRRKLKEISDFAFGHGILTIGKEHFITRPPDSWGKDLLDQFFVACNEGFKIAQRILIVEVQKYQLLQRETKIQLKEFRRQKNKEKEKLTKIEIKIIVQRLQNFSHIADGIAWQLIGGKIHVARRFYIQEKSSKYLDSSNIKHAIETAEEINKDPYAVALISDLTSFVQIGDLLIRSSEKIGILELKEGKVNEQINEFLAKSKNCENEFTDEELTEIFDLRTIEQLKRIQRQQDRILKVINILNNDTGIDPVSGQNIFLQTPTILTEYYHEELIKLEEELKDKIWSYNCLETCLHLGAYRDDAILFSKTLINEILKSKTSNYILIDWLTIKQNLSEPIFAKPFSPEFIIDILTGKVRIIMGLDFDALIETFNVFGLKSRWLTEKETMKYQQSKLGSNIVKINKRGIAITLVDKKELIISGGTISKILYDNILPSSIAKSILNTISPD